MTTTGTFTFGTFVGNGVAWPPRAGSVELGACTRVGVAAGAVGVEAASFAAVCVGAAPAVGAATDGEYGWPP